MNNSIKPKALSLSVLMPVYNEVYTAAECVERVLAVHSPYISKIELIMVWGLALVLITEFLSLFKMVVPLPIALSWLFFSLVADILLIRLRLQKVKFDERFIPLNHSEKLLLPLTALIFIITFTVAVIAPPNNYDSMTYHMSRVAHWAQNNSLAHYPTFIIRQLNLEPGSEMIITTFYVLTGGDRFSSMVYGK